jgi:hypothetical protein
MKKLILIFLTAISVFLGGCQRPVEPKVAVTVNTNETLFVIPLQGESINAQVKFDSSAYEKFKKVAVREYYIPHYWLNEGRNEWMNDGKWKPAVKVIKVDRSPVTVELAVSDKHTGKKDADAIWLESADSVGFSTGFSISALITEEDTATYLYRYSENALRITLQTEVRARIQKIAAEFAARYPLDGLRAKKNEMLAEINKDVIEFFKTRGITITTIGQFGGMTYENPNIQGAIDAVFISQQEKEKAKAALAAQADINAKSESAAQQDRLNAITLADGAAQAALKKASAEASAIKLVSDATKEAASNPTFLEIRKLEIEAKKLDKWNGSVPSTLIEGGGTTGLNMFLK